MFAIEAQLVQKGSELSGQMTDTDRTMEVSFDQLIEDGPFKAWSEDPRNRAALFEKRSQNLRLRTVLPEHSELMGTVRGSAVNFEKRYTGLTSSAWVSETGEQARHEFDGSPVRYVGELDASGSQIIGTWTIKGRGLFGKLLKPLAQGAFQLERQ